MASKRQEISTVLSFSTKFNATDLISKIKQVQAQFGDKGIPIFDIDDDIRELEILQKKLDEMRSKGFTSSADLTESSKLMNQILKLSEKIQNGFEQIGTEKLTDDLREAKKRISDLQKELKSLSSTARKSLSGQLQNLGFGKDESAVYARALLDTDQSEEAAQRRLEVEKQIRTVLSEQVEELKAAQITEKDITSATSGIGGKTTKVKNRQRELNIARNKLNDISSIESISSQQQAEIDKYIEDIIKRGQIPQAATFAKNLSASAGLDKKEAEEYYRSIVGLIREVIEAEKELQNATEEREAARQKVDNLKVQQTEQAEALAAAEERQAQAEQLLGSGEGSYSETLGALTAKTQELNTETAKRDQLNEELEQGNSDLVTSARQLANARDDAKKSSEDQRKEDEKTLENQQQIDNLFSRLGERVKYIFSIATAWQQVRNAISQTLSDIKELDKSFAEIAMVTSYSVSDLWAQYDTYAEMANRLGQTTNSVIQASGLYYQQGLQTQEVMKLTEDTMKLATLAGLDFKDATSQMTAALRAFHMEMDQGSHVTDVYAEVAAHAAVDVQGIADAMSATAAIANSAGMSFENTTAMLATMVEATQEAPKNLGTAMKTVR